MDYESTVKVIADKLYKLKKLTPSQETFAVNNVHEVKDALDELNRISRIG